MKRTCAFLVSHRLFPASRRVFSPVVALIVASCGPVRIEGGTALVLQNDHRASRSDAFDLTIQSGETLKADLRSGVVRIASAGAAGAKPGVKARITAFGSTAEEAAENLDKCKLRIARADSGAAIRFEGEDFEYREKFTIVKMRPQLELDITVPDGVALDIDSGNGSIHAVGPFASCELNSRYGSVELTYADGDVRAQTSSGHVKISKVAGAHTVVAKSGYGNVTVSDTESEKLTAESSSGSVEITDTKAASIVSESRYGKLVFTRVAGAIHGKTSSGSVNLTDSAEGEVELESGYGSITVQKASGRRAVVQDFNVER